MNKEQTAMQELFVQLKLQLGNNKVSQMFDEVYWLVKEQEQIEKAFDSGYSDGLGAGTGLGELKYNDVSYYQSKYGGQHD